MVLVLLDCFFISFYLYILLVIDLKFLFIFLFFCSLVDVLRGHWSKKEDQK